MWSMQIDVSSLLERRADSAVIGKCSIQMLPVSAALYAAELGRMLQP
jgi:hypothetical protein